MIKGFAISSGRVRLRSVAHQSEKSRIGRDGFNRKFKISLASLIFFQTVSRVVVSVPDLQATITSEVLI